MEDKQKGGVKLSILISVVAIVAVIVLIATMMLSNSAQSVRKEAFAVTANEVVAAAQDAYAMYTSGELDLKNDENTSCAIDEDKICYTVEYLKSIGLFTDETGSYSGKVIVDYSQGDAKFILYLAKGAEYNITAGIKTDYSDYGGINSGGWTSDDGQTTCACMENE